MTITIKLTASSSNKGVSFNSYMKSYFKDFSFEGWPYILGGSGEFKGTQIVLLDNMNGRNTKTIVLDGRSIAYDLGKHEISGSLTTVRLGTLGNSYKDSGAFTEDSAGRITNISAQVQVSGLAIAGTEFHSLVSGLMGGVSTSRKANPAVLNAALADEAHNLIGSSGSDSYTGTRFSDRIKGNAGNDSLTGGVGADDLWGGAGADSFIFKTVAESTVKTSGRDTIFDFSAAQKDKIHLSSIDANTLKGGNQAFAFIGTQAFSGQAGELRYEKKASDTYIYGDVNGDKVADFAIHLDDPVDLLRSYFVL
ncbi:M10 family metallopeptidase C-terminal domain-containing protein [Microvirga zambiensis]|uniref:M10 family metallopeptidase C-terminal domain-containing protein n=1 Tax=Microvirga zambiensis TaxID=1402137 RepID=UPI00191D370F